MAGSSQVGIEVGVKDKATPALKEVAKAFADLDRAASGDGPMLAGDGIASLSGKLGPAAKTAAMFADTIGAKGLGNSLRELWASFGASSSMAGVGGAEAMLARLGPVSAVAGAGLAIATSALTALAGAGALAAGVVVSASTAAFTLAANSASAGDAAGESAAKVGLSAEAYTRLSFAARQNATDVQHLEAGLRDMATRVAAQPKAFAQWGVAIRDANGRLLSTEQIANNVADRMATLGSAAERNALAQDLMGRSGRDLVQVMSLGSAGLAEFGAEADRVGATIDSTAAILAGQFNDQLDSTKDTFSAVAREAGTAFQPAITVAMEAAQDLAAGLLGRIMENREAFEAFATKSVAMLARAFATLTEIGSGLSHVLEGAVSVFTFRLGDAFDEARGMADEVAGAARRLATDLELGAAVTRDEVVPAVQSETAERAKLVGALGKEKTAREDLRALAGEAAASALTAASAAERLGRSTSEAAQMAAANILEQEAGLQDLEEMLSRVEGAYFGVRQAALANGATIKEARAEELAAEGATRDALRAQIAAQRQRVREAVAAGQEIVKVVEAEAKARAASSEEYRQELEAERQATADAARVRDQQLDEDARRRLAILDLEINEHKRHSAETKTLQDAQRKEIEQTRQTVQGFVSNGLGSLYSEMRGVFAGTQDLGTAMKNLGGSVLESLAQIGIGIAAQKASMALLQALGTTAAAADLGVAKTTAASQINASAATAAAAAFAAYAGIPVVGPALGAAAAAAAYAQTLGWVGALAFARGGEVPGFGSRDSVPAMLTPGEYVLPRSVVQDIRSGSPPGPVSGGGGSGGNVTIVLPKSTIPATEAQMEEQLRGAARVLERMGFTRGRRR